MPARPKRTGRDLEPAEPARVLLLEDDSDGLLVIDQKARTVLRNGVEIGLTRTEHGLLTALCHSGRILSKQELLDQVWGVYAGNNANLVEAHMCALRRKLEAHGPRLIHTVSGYVLRP